VQVHFSTPKCAAQGIREVWESAEQGKGMCQRK
jgi:hypothetical protein